MGRDNILEGLTPHVGLVNTTDDKHYKLADIKAIPGATCEEPIREVYVIVVPETEESCWTVFGAFEWVTEDDNDIYVSPIFVGHGISSNLRELRHTYWGPDRDGYLFYMNLDKTIAALQVLKKYFDGD